jgi:hypothetical protein
MWLPPGSGPEEHEEYGAMQTYEPAHEHERSIPQTGGVSTQRTWLPSCVVVEPQT